MLIPFPPLSSDPNNIWGDKWLTCNSSQIKGIKKKKKGFKDNTQQQGKQGKDASFEHGALLLKASILVFCLGFPWEPKAESRQDLDAEVWVCFPVEVSGQPCSGVHCGLPRPSPQVEIGTVFNGCWVKALSCMAGGSGSLAVEFHGANTLQQTPGRAPSIPWWCFSFLQSYLLRSLGE